jgi:CMP-N-acetylneuraminic acid synthetase
MNAGCLGLIVARGGSKGIVGKNLHPLGGRPLISHTFQAAGESKVLDRIVLSTDSPEIAEAGRAAGVEVPFLRPPELAKDTTPTLDVIRHALDWLGREEAYRPDIVVLLQPTSPLRQARHIDEALGLLASGDADSVVSVVPVPAHFNPHWQFVVEDGMIRTFTGETLAAIAPRRQGLEETFSRNGAIYAFRRASLEKHGTIYGERCAAYVMAPEDSVNIDGPEDLEAAERMLAGRAVE